MDLATIIVAAVSALLSGGGAAAVVSVLARRKLTSAEVTEKLTDSAIQMLEVAKREARADVADMRAELAETRAELSDARREAAEARRRMREIRQDAESLVGFLDRVLTAINDPKMTIGRLRVLVGQGPPNGLGTLRESDS